MPDTALPIAIPVAEEERQQYQAAAQLLERAVQVGCQDPHVLYMLAMAHKRQGKINDKNTRFCLFLFFLCSLRLCG